MALTTKLLTLSCVSFLMFGEEPRLLEEDHVHELLHIIDDVKSISPDQQLAHALLRMTELDNNHCINYHEAQYVLNQAQDIINKLEHTPIEEIIELSLHEFRNDLENHYGHPNALHYSDAHEMIKIVNDIQELSDKPAPKIEHVQNAWSEQRPILYYEAHEALQEADHILHENSHRLPTEQIQQLHEHLHVLNHVVDSKNHKE